MRGKENSKHLSEANRECEWFRPLPGRVKHRAWQGAAKIVTEVRQSRCRCSDHAIRSGTSDIFMKHTSKK